MLLKRLSLVFGIVFLLVGILGFIPAFAPDGYLLGIFQISAVHNLIHILSGIAALIGATSERYASLYFLVFGAVYTLVALVGWIQMDTVLGLISVNVADNLLHTVLAVAILGIGLFVKPRSNNAVVA